MRHEIILLVMLMGQPVFGQRYEQTLKKCIESFQDGLSKFNKDQSATEVERRYAVLNACMQGQKFPAFRLATYNGERYSSEESAGKVVLLNFWTTKSETGVAALAYLNALAAEYKGKDFLILSFTIDEIQPLVDFLANHPVKFRVFAKSRDLVNHQFTTILGYPTNIILNKKGEVVDYRVGGGTAPEVLRKTKDDMKRILDSELER